LILSFSSIFFSIHGPIRIQSTKRSSKSTYGKNVPDKRGAGCLGYGENKQKGDNEGGLLKPCPASTTRFVFIIPDQRKKSTLFSAE
jgi:hypothetical protein